MKQKLISFIAGAKAGAASFLRRRGIYVVALGVVAATGAAAALLLGAPAPEETAPPEPIESAEPASFSEDERLTLLKTPEPTKTPMPDFTEAPKTPAPTEKPMWSPPVRGEVIWGFAINELIYSRTLEQWMTHDGVDVASPKGTEVNAIFGGTVHAVYEDDALGATVEIENGGWRALYANLKKDPPVKEGAKVNAGDVLGEIGDTAVSECGDRSHVHFALYKDNEPVDPQKYVRFIKE